MRTRTRGIMTLLAAARSLSVLNSLPTSLGRGGGRCTHAFCLAALTTQRHVLLRSSPVISIHNHRSSSSSSSTSTSSLQRASSTWGLPVSPRHESLRISTALSAKGSTKRGKLNNSSSSSRNSSSSSNNSNSSSNNNSSSGNNSNKQRQLSSSSRAAPDAAIPGAAETRGKGGAVGSSAGSEQPASSRPAWTGPRLAGPRPVAATTAVAAAGAVGWTSPYASSNSAGRGGGGRGQIRGLHENGPTQPDRPPEIPEDQLQFSFSRSSGAGGQNVNKLSTKVEMRFVVSDADWLPHDVRLRLARQQSGRVNNRGELVVTAQEFRTQRQNRSQALHKLREMLDEAWEPAKERKLRTGISKAGKETRKADKRHRSQVKAGRSKVGSRDFEYES